MPESNPILRSHPLNRTRLAWWEWNPAAKHGGPTVVLAHATGFHGRVWDAIVAEFPGRHVISLDLRGHGHSAGEQVDSWSVFAGDTAAVLDHLGIAQATGVGHSMGGHTLLQVCADRPGSFAKLVLFDPVILEQSHYDTEETGEPHPTIKRKRYFDSPEAMIERFKGRDPYSLFDPRVLRDYCRHGLRERSDEGYELCCTPEMEASIYMSSRSNGGILDAARGTSIPVTVVRARQTGLHDFKSSPTWPGLAAIMRDGRDIYRPDMTHFHPFQDPTDAARIIVDAERNGGGRSGSRTGL